MKEINIKDWSIGIGKFIEKYANTVRDAQLEFKKNGRSKEYTYLLRQCEDQRRDLQYCINNIHNHNLLSHE